MQFPTLDQLKDRRTRKWTVYDDDILPLWIAESDFFTCPPVKQAMSRSCSVRSAATPRRRSAAR